MVGESLQSRQIGDDATDLLDNAAVIEVLTADDVSSRANRDRAIDDPPPVTPFDIVEESGLLRLRHYRCADGAARQPPVLLVCSLFKRPYILDLLPERSVVRSLLRQGFPVYLTDWLPPLPEDAGRGLDAYVNQDLARAVECVRSRERVEQVSLVGCCFGGLLAVIYAALYPQRVRRLVPFALPIEMRPLLAPAAAEYMARVYGNIPAWWIRAALNARVANPFQLPSYLAQELGEPELAQAAGSPPPAVQRALERWFGSDVPLAGRLFCEVIRDVFDDAQLATSRLRVGGRRVALEHISCPVLNICAERDQLVPPQASASFVEHLGSREESSNLVFPSGHLGLMVGLAAQQKLWPRVGAWLRSDIRGEDRVQRTAAASNVSASSRLLLLRHPLALEDVP